MSDLQNTSRRFLLRELNIFGFDHLDPVFLAALADERPLLLIGAHGTAKSELLNRLAAALELEHRHFNASLISFDDLLGYPVPNGDRNGLEYLRTPGDLWDAESVLLDEISRCRPEIQNKLFSVIHERRVQGLPLEHLRYRWAAMNPPVALDDDDAEHLDSADIYHGSLPLDPALADRFAYVVSVPGLLDLSAANRRRLLAHGGSSPEKPTDIAGQIAATRDHLTNLGDGLRKWAAAYVEGLIVPLHEAGLDISGRRAVSLGAAVLSVCAAGLALDRQTNISDAAYLALKWGLPHRALGRRINEPQLMAVHRIAERAAGAPEDPPWRIVNSEPDPVKRIVQALELAPDAVNRRDLSALVQEALAESPPAERHALALNLFPVFSARDRLTATVYEQITDLVFPVLQFTEGGRQELQTHRNRAAGWDRLLSVIIGMEKAGDPLLPDIGNLLYALFAAEVESFDPLAVASRYREWRDLFTPFFDREAA